MAEYIEREKVRDEFYQCVLDGTITSVEDTGKFLRDFPGADVAPVVHGRWKKQSGLYSCSVCGKVCPYDVQADVIEYWTCNYCPNCGANMKDGE